MPDLPSAEGSTPNATPTPAAAAPAAVATPAADTATPAATPAVAAAEPAPADGAKPAATEPVKPEGAPEKYEFKAASDEVKFDDKVIGAFSEVAKELNLPQKDAQKILDKVAPLMAAQQVAAQAAAKSAWEAASQSDKEFGGEKINENLTVAKKAFDAFGTPELRKLLDDSGLGNHPEIIRAFYRAGKAISEDKVVTGGAGAVGSQTAANALYPSQPK